MAASIQNDDEMFTGINVTPLVDIVLVLLVILMVTAGYVASKTIPMDLPRGATGEQIPTTLAISIDRAGQIYADAVPVDDAGLLSTARAARARDDELRATIAADGSVPHARVVRVIDLLRQAHVDKFAIDVDPTALAVPSGS